MGLDQGDDDLIPLIHPGHSHTIRYIKSNSPVSWATHEPGIPVEHWMVGIFLLLAVLLAVQIAVAILK